MRESCRYRGARRRERKAVVMEVRHTGARRRRAGQEQLGREGGEVAYVERGGKSEGEREGLGFYAKTRHLGIHKIDPMMTLKH